MNIIKYEENRMKKILILMLIFLLITPYVLAEESIPKLDIVAVDYPKTPWMGQELSLIITLDYDLLTPAYGFIILAQLESERDTFLGLQMDKMWDEHKPSELPSTHISRTWKTAGREGYENFTLQFPIPTYLFGEETIVLDTYSVVWDDTTKTVTIDDGTIIVNITIGSSTMLVNGVPQILENIPYLDDGKTIIQVREVSEALGASVEWIEDFKYVDVVN